MIEEEELCEVLLRGQRLQQWLQWEELRLLNQRLESVIAGRYERHAEPTFPFTPDVPAHLLSLVYRDVCGRRRPRQTEGEIVINLKENQVRELLRQLRSSDEELWCLLDDLAALLGLTYAELGDGALLADDEALERIRERLLDYDEDIVTRNYRRGYERWRPPSPAGT